MAKRDQLRELRTGTIINLTAKQQETELGAAIVSVVADIGEQFGLEMHHRREWRLTEIVDDLMAVFPEVDFERPGPRSSMKPDGGVLSLLDIEGKRHPILIAEVKNQGTNDLREAEGKARQAMGNAIERLGKNVIGVRTAMMPEGIVPLVCFGYGIDFDEASSILDRVRTIAMFGELNQIHVVNVGESSVFNRGSFFFRRAPWTAEEMSNVMSEIGRRSIYYYFAKYGENHFQRANVVSE